MVPETLTVWKVFSFRTHERYSWDLTLAEAPTSNNEENVFGRLVKEANAALLNSSQYTLLKSDDDDTIDLHDLLYSSSEEFFCMSAAAAVVFKQSFFISRRVAFLIDKCKSINQLLQIHVALLRHGLNHHPILNFKLQRSLTLPLAALTTLFPLRSNR
ncbi:hypothetical protein K1719_019666 [Acacia pycnantha]|nr:hypothetical protein K1719_019666 [Acacia pycnantha]